MNRLWFLALVGAMALPGVASAQVLGPCGTKDAKKPAASPVTTSAVATASLPTMTRVPLPGEQAPNFELTALVGDKIKRIKLSDYAGKWRVVCFYPADFTFV